MAWLHWFPWLIVGCSWGGTDQRPPQQDAPDAVPRTSSSAPRLPSAPNQTNQPTLGSSSVPTIQPERELQFPFRPQRGPVGAYRLTDPRDQHRILVMKGVAQGKPKALLALHGQPSRHQSPRDYAFLETVQRLSREMVESGEIEPFVLLLPVFRFEGQNWPGFDLGEFLEEANRRLHDLGLQIEHPYVVGHSGAAGCGGEGMNGVAALEPSAVGFLDTCVGAGFQQAVRALTKKRIPTLVLHSVETAAFRPRNAIEYDPNFDFGRVYRPLGLSPSVCPEQLPEVPLRPLAYRCATDLNGTTRALVIDTGTGEAAHNRVVPVGLRYFLRTAVVR